MSTDITQLILELHEIEIMETLIKEVEADLKDGVPKKLQNELDALLKKANPSSLEPMLEDIAVHTGASLTREEAFATKRCCKCGKPAINFRDECSRREYNQTIWCQECQDKFFGV